MGPMNTGELTLRERVEKAEACCAEMREVLEKSPALYDTAASRQRKAHALSTDCGKGWLSPEKVKELQTGLLNVGFMCAFSGPGSLGDCKHFVGLPGKSIPGQHDGKDDTVDVYGKPNGWCWPCWKDYRIGKLQEKVHLLTGVSDAAQDLHDFLHDNAGTTADWPIDLVAHGEDPAIQLHDKLEALRKALAAVKENKL